MNVEEIHQAWTSAFRGPPILEEVRLEVYMTLLLYLHPIRRKRQPTKNGLHFVGIGIQRH